MPGQRSQLKSLEAQKQILLVKSDLNRVQLLQDWNLLKGEIHQLTRSVQTVGSIASSAAKIGTMFLFLRRLTHIIRQKKPTSGQEPAKSSFISNLLTGVSTGFSLWEKLRSRP